MLEFVLFVLVMSFTPGPNTILGLTSGQEVGFKRSLPYNLGIGIGMTVIYIIVALIGQYLMQISWILVSLRMIGTVYLIYLAYHVMVSEKVGAVQAQVVTLKTGIMLQFVNVKVYLFTLTGLTGFAVLNEHLLVKWFIMVGISVMGTLTWTGAGVALRSYYNAHYRLINGLVAGLLLFSAIDLW